MLQDGRLGLTARPDRAPFLAQLTFFNPCLRNKFLVDKILPSTVVQGCVALRYDRVIHGSTV